MKTKFLFAFAITAFAIASCSRNDITLIPTPDTNSGSPVKFNTYIPQTPDFKGLETTGNTTGTTAIESAGVGFGVNAIYTGTADIADVLLTSTVPNFMYKVHVTYDGTPKEWIYSPLKYWPEGAGDQISFYAWAPYNNTVIVPQDGKVNQLVFNQGTADATVDFVAAAILDQVKPTDPSKADEMTFVLKHELTRIKAQVSASQKLYDPADLKYSTKLVIKDVVIKDGSKIYDDATYTFTDDEAKRGIWNPGTQHSGDYSIMPIVNASSTTGITGYTENGFSVLNQTPQNLFQTNHNLYLIPANGENGLLADGDVTFRFTYDVVTNDGSTPIPATREVKLPAGSLKQGVSYLLNFIFTTDDIVMSATVADWGTDEGLTEYIPQP